MPKNGKVVTLEENRTSRSKNHSIILENREKLSISGVERVDNFNDELIVLQTVEGILTIKGEDLDVSKLNVEDGNVSVKGVLNSLSYSDRQSFGEKSSGLLGKMFK